MSRVIRVVCAGVRVVQLQRGPLKRTRLSFDVERALRWTPMATIEQQPASGSMAVRLETDAYWSSHA